MHNSHPDTAKSDWKLDDVRGVLEVDMNIDDQLAAGRALADKITFYAALAALVVAVVEFLAARALAGPVGWMTDAMTKISDGVHDVEIPAKERQDELEKIAAAVEVFKTNIVEMERLREDRDSQRDQPAQSKQQGAIALADTFDTDVGAVIARVSEAAGEMKTSAHDVSVSVRDTVA